MKFVAPIFVVATSSFMIACSSSPSRPAGKPAAGPPPEYEAPRSFDLPKTPGEEAPPATPAPGPAPTPSADQPAPTP